MDICNEIHDMDEVYITWGKSNNIATDWRAASSMAAKTAWRLSLSTPRKTDFISRFGATEASNMLISVRVNPFLVGNNGRWLIMNR